MNLLTVLLEALGLKELARRAGVSPGTLKRWQRSGPSARGLDVLAGILSRRERSKRAAQTRTAKKRQDFQNRLPMPATPYRSFNRPSSGELTPEQMLPNEPPVKTARDLKSYRAAEGHDGIGEIDTLRNFGESVWIAVGAPLVDADVDHLADQAISIWQQSERAWIHIVFLLFRYIPFNPLYRGEMISKQGKWDAFWTQTPLAATLDSIANGIESALEVARVSAHSRLIWLEGAKVRVFDRKERTPFNIDERIR